MSVRKSADPRHLNINYISRDSYIDCATCMVARVCVSVRGRMPTLVHGPECNLGEWWGKGMPIVVHYWADLQSVHGYGNTTRTRNVSEYMLVLALCLVCHLLSRTGLHEFM